MRSPRGCAEVESGDLHAVIHARMVQSLLWWMGRTRLRSGACGRSGRQHFFNAQAHRPLLDAVRYCHEALIGTRGVVMRHCVAGWRDETITWLSIGNVAGLLLRARNMEREHVLMRNGVVGHRLPPLRAATQPLQRGDLLIFATDGVREDFGTEVRLDARPQDTADRLLARYGKVTDDALVLVGRWNGPPTGVAP